MTDSIIIVDIDGTVALKGERSPYDWDRVNEDLPNIPVVVTVRSLYHEGYDVIFTSGRKEYARKGTEDWLKKYLDINYLGLFMRPNDCGHRDAVLKRAIYETEIKGKYKVFLVLDDRQQVVNMWRALGLTVFQVAEGNF